MKIAINLNRRSGMGLVGVVVFVALLVVALAGVIYAIWLLLTGLGKIMNGPRKVDEDEQPEQVSEVIRSLPASAMVASRSVWAVESLPAAQPGAPVYSYTVEHSTDLAHWTHLTNWQSTNAMAEWSMPVDPQKPCGFFRITKQSLP
jgi:hypothetical protein